MAIALQDQYFVELARNAKYTWLAVIVSVLLPAIHGLLFLWIPWYLRSKRSPDTLGHDRYFSFIKAYSSFNKVFKFTIFKHNFYYQPSLLVIMAIHVALCGVFCFVQTKDIDYEPRYYIVSKRVGRICIGNLPIILLFVSKNTFISALSGLSLDRCVFFHKWLGRFMFITAIIHTWMSLVYWLDMKFYIMVQIPPQIFGFIAFSCLGMLNVASFKFIRNFAFDFFLAQHRVFNFIMLLLAYFHNGGNHAPVILGVHLLVLDRVIGRILGLIHKYKGPTKGLSDFEVLDETTVRVSIPIKLYDSDRQKWWWSFVPRYGNWRAGQHVVLNVFKVAWFQYHPFTIASLAESGKMVFVIKVHKGFTRKLLQKLNKMSDALDAESTVDNEIEATSELSDSRDSSSVSSSVDSQSKLTGKGHAISEVYSPSVQEFQSIINAFQLPEILQLGALMNGPFGGTYQPLTKFESVIFFSAGSGASFTLPVALELLKMLKQRDEADDYLYRPQKTQVTIVMAMKKVANLQWFDHLWEEFIPFLDSGRAHLAFHVTQEVPDASEPEEEIKDRVFAKSKTEESFNTTFESTSSVGEKGFSITYGRPDFDELIGSRIKQLCSKSYRRSFACLGCGPGAFNDEMKRSCEKFRWIEGAPDVYCYRESFD